MRMMIHESKEREDEMHWEKEAEKRLAEATELRGRMEEVGNKLLKVRTGFNEERARARELRRQREPIETEFFSEWVRSDAASEPDPRTRKTNQKWRDTLWREARRANPQIARLDAVLQQESDKERELIDQINELQGQMDTLGGRAFLLSAELNLLASLIAGKEA
jgi:hypothetical protein